MNNIIQVAELPGVRSTLPGAKKLVLATGCFDILHIGHLYFLDEASQQGDVLVVGLNSDRAVRLIKGPGKPIVTEDHRIAVIAALRYVNLAFIYDDVVADGCIGRLNPDVFVIGEESAGAYPSEVETAHALGARVHVVRRMPHVSTTSVLARIRNQ